jgi:hypothetical protein
MDADLDRAAAAFVSTYTSKYAYNERQGTLSSRYLARLGIAVDQY